MGVLRDLPENGVPLSQTGRVLIQTTEQKERDTVQWSHRERQVRVCVCVCVCVRARARANVVILYS